MQHPRPPLALILIALILALSILAGVLSWAAWQFTLLPPALAAALRVVIFLSPVGAGILGGAIAWRRWGSHEYIKAAHVTRLTAAQAQRFPAALQSLSYHDSSKPQILPAEPEPPLLAPPSLEIPTFAQLLDQGRIGPNAPLLLGFDAASGQAITGTWKDLYSCGIGGLQGSGKTWAAVYLLCQSALQGGRLVICDPHASDAESLAARIAPLQSAMICDIAADDRSILAALKTADDKLQRRKQGHTARWPIVAAIDEFLSLRRGALAELLPDLIEDFSTEGRKLNCHCLLLSQRWDKAAIGDFRNTLASNYIYRMRRQEAAMMTGLPAGGGLPDDTLNLAPGECYLLDTRGACRRIVIPTMTQGDVARVGAMLELVNRPAAQPFGFTPAAGVVATNRLPTGYQQATDQATTAAQSNQATTASGSAGSLTPEAVRAATLFRDGRTPAEIVKELRGIESNAGRRYQAALAEVLDLIRTGMKGTQP